MRSYKNPQPDTNLIMETQKCICDHIIIMFDNPIFSDFRIVLEKTNECVHDLSHIMMKNKHFETFLTTKVGDAKKTLYKVENVKIVIIAYCIYTDELSITDDLSLNDFINLVNLSDMWKLIFFNNAIYEIKSIFWYTEGVDVMMPGENYSIAPKDCVNLPDINTIVYRTEDL